MTVTAFAFGGTHLAGNFVDAGSTASALGARLGPLAGNMFAIVLLNASLIGAAAVTLSTTYAFGDVFGVKHSLHRSWKDAGIFYGLYTCLVIAAGGIVLLPGAPLGLMTTAVQALAGILLPSATVFLLLLCNDRAVLGPWVNGVWSNVLAAIIVGVLIMLSLILAAATLFPALNIQLVAAVLAGFLVLALLVVAVVQFRSRGSSSAQEASEPDRATWRMPPLSTLPRPVWSTPRKAGMLTLRLYLVLAAAMMAIKIVQLALGH
jgi:Mn2+/Fe2+ NRAMP family transporter